jgi:DNA-binding NtrC family response regulator
VRLLVADSDDQVRNQLAAYCRSQGIQPIVVSTGVDALRHVADGDIDAVVVDLMLPDVSGDTMVEEVHRHHADLPVLLMTNEPSVEEAVQLLRRGAADYLTKPLTAEVFNHRINEVLRSARLQQELHELKSAGEGGTIIIGQAPALQQLLERLPLAATTNAVVLITGESGTGKELVARRVHELSSRAGKRFVAVNCGALTDSLLESELFGYKRGAFTDATRDTPGLVEEAEGGTLFLDEIGEVSPSLQVKLLRFLQLREYKVLGSPKTLKADVRIVAATNRDLREQVKLGRFREDLYYRLNIIPLHLPPLRERRADVPLLAMHFLDSYRRQYERPARSFSTDALVQLMAYDWPGNVRELENRVQQMVVWSDQETIHNVNLVSVDAPTSVQRATDGSFKEEKKRLIESFERDYVDRILARTNGNMTEAARLAGIDRKSFFDLTKRLRSPAQAPWPSS